MATRTREDTRQALFDAALDLFGTYGFSDTTHADIAATVGIGRTTFYEYFASTEDLLVDLVEDRLPAITRDIVGSVAPDLHPVERMRVLIAKLIEFVGTDHLGLILHTEAPRLSADAQTRIADAHRDLSRVLANVYEQGIRDGELVPLPRRLAGHLVYQAIMTAGRELMDTGDPKQHVDTITDACTRFVLDGLREPAHRSQ